MSSLFKRTGSSFGSAAADREPAAAASGAAPVAAVQATATAIPPPNTQAASLTVQADAVPGSTGELGSGERRPELALMAKSEAGPSIRRWSINQGQVYNAGSSSGAASSSGAGEATPSHSSRGTSPLAADTHDSGVKVRVHAQRMLLLCRLFMRLDGVAVRVRDTRLYVDFETDQVLREYTAREDGFENVKRALVMSGRLPDDVTAALRDPNVLAPMLPAVEESLEGVCLSS